VEFVDDWWMLILWSLKSQRRLRSRVVGQVLNYDAVSVPLIEVRFRWRFGHAILPHFSLDSLARVVLLYCHISGLSAVHELVHSRPR